MAWNRPPRPPPPGRASSADRRGRRAARRPEGAFVNRWTRVLSQPRGADPTVRRERVQDARPRPDGPNRNPGFSCADVCDQTLGLGFPGY